MWQDEARLVDILLACREAHEYTKGVTLDEFRADGILQRAVSMVLVVIGEAARAVSVEFKETSPHIPWKDIVGLRNRIIHEYFRLDLNIMWEIIHKDIPILQAMIEPLVPRELELPTNGD